MEKPGDSYAVERLRGTVTYMSIYLPGLTDLFRTIGQFVQRDVERI